MSDITIDKSGASKSEQRQLQKLIQEINPDALPKYGADGSIGGETTTALQEILGADASGSMTVEQATKALQDIVNKKAFEVDAGKLATDDSVSKENAQLIQKMIQEIDSGALPKFGADGDIGGETITALKGVFPDVDPAQISMGDLVAKLEEKIDELPERYTVKRGDNLSDIACDVYADDIEKYTQELMDSGDPKFATEKAARVHAVQVAVTKIAFADGNKHYKLTEGDNAAFINKGQVLEIPDAGALKEVDGSLDWGSLDAAVVVPVVSSSSDVKSRSPREIKSSFTPAVHDQPRAGQSGLPSRVQLSSNCWAVLKGSDRGGVLGLFKGAEKPRYQIKGEELNNPYSVLKQKLKGLGHDVDIRSNGRCEFPHEGGDNDGLGGAGKDGNSTGEPSGGPSTGL